MLRGSATSRDRLTTLSLTCLLLVGIVLSPAIAEDANTMSRYSVGPVFGGSGRTPGKFYAVSDVAVGPDGSVYACDYENHRVQKLSAEGTFIRAWGSCGRGPGQFSGPTGIATDTKGNVYVVEESNPRVQKFTPDGQLVAKWTVPVSHKGEFTDLSGIAIDLSNNVLVVSQRCHRVWKFTPWGRLAASWTSGPIVHDEPDFGAGSLGIATDRPGNIYVMNIERERIERYSPAGELVTSWKTPVGGVAVDGQGRVHVTDENCIRVYSQSGLEIGRFADGLEAASRLAFAPDGSLYVAEGRESRVRHLIRTPQPDAPAVEPTPSATGDSTPHENGRIAFVRSLHGNDDIYVIQPDGSDLKRLTTGPAVDWHPSWSPDGTRIAFSSKRDGRSSIYAMADDGSGVAKLTSGPGNDYEPAWSPDGKSIAFRRAIGDTEEADNDLWLVNADGSEPRQLTSGHWCDLSPAWSHDGKRIIFARRYDGSGTHSGLQVINADGTGLRDVVVPGGDSCEEPAFSPDARSLVYVATGTSCRLMLRSLQGSGLKPLIGSDNLCNPAWSPDGKYIVCHKGYPDSSLCRIDVSSGNVEMLDALGRDAAWGNTATVSNAGSVLPTGLEPVRTSARRLTYERYVGRQKDIFVVREDGTADTNLTNHPSDDENPRWSPDGQRIGFTSDRDGTTGIWSIGADGGDATKLADGDEFDWSPDGLQIVFQRYSGNREIWVKDLTTGLERKLRECRGGSPLWSPDGRHIAFVDKDEIWVMDADGSNACNVAPYPLDQSSGTAWSPDGQMLAFSRDDLGAFPVNIFVVRIDGSGLQQITSNRNVNDDVTWSPDGRLLAYNSGSKLCVATVGTRNITELAGGITQCSDPAWSPDGTTIAYGAWRGTNDCEIHTVRLDGSGDRAITVSGVGKWSPRWSPR